jgi:gluconokinase
MLGAASSPSLQSPSPQPQSRAPSPQPPASASYAAIVVVILLGVTGAGKTTVGQALVARHRWRFVDGDDYHTSDAVARMRNGVPLTDSDRAPWLASLHAVASAAIERREGLVIACSALKQSYRNTLRGALRPVRFVYLRADKETLRQRLSNRQGHFAGPALLASQLADLEEPADALNVDATRTPDEIVNEIDYQFGL